MKLMRRLWLIFVGIIGLLANHLITVSASDTLVNLCSYISADFGQCPQWLSVDNTTVIIQYVSLILLLSGALWTSFPLLKQALYVERGTPQLGSLVFVECVPTIYGNVSTGLTDAEIRVGIKNTNDYLVKFDASIFGSFNGKTSQGSADKPTVDFSGYVAAREQTSLILKFPNVPSVPPNSSSMHITGEFLYEVSYYAAERANGVRRTRKHVWFDAPAQLMNRAIQHAQFLNFYFKDEDEK